MSLNRLFDIIENVRDTAHWRAAFGEPQALEGRTIIPVSAVTYGFGFGFGQGTSGPDEEESGSGGGGGGSASSRPLGVLVVDDEGVRFSETADASRLGLAGILLAGLAILQVALTLRAIFGRK
jgi:uncharacterized spore protein YtfJ